MPLEIFLPKLSGDRYQSSDITFGYLRFSVYVFGGVFFFCLQVLLMEGVLQKVLHVGLNTQKDLFSGFFYLEQMQAKPSVG